jgi:hypothetical protein
VFRKTIAETVAIERRLLFLAESGLPGAAAFGQKQSDHDLLTGQKTYQ